MKNKKKNSKYSLVRSVLLKTDFEYAVDKQNSNIYHYLLKATYPCCDKLITYYLSVPRCEDYLKIAKKMIRGLIMNDTLCIHTLKIIPYEEFKQYATR